MTELQAKDTFTLEELCRSVIICKDLINSTLTDKELSVFNRRYPVPTMYAIQFAMYKSNRNRIMTKLVNDLVQAFNKHITHLVSFKDSEIACVLALQGVCSDDISDIIYRTRNPIQ